MDLTEISGYTILDVNGKTGVEGLEAWISGDEVGGPKERQETYTVYEKTEVCNENNKESNPLQMGSLHAPSVGEKEVHKRVNSWEKTPEGTDQVDFNVMDGVTINWFNK